MKAGSVRDRRGNLATRRVIVWVGFWIGLFVLMHRPLGRAGMPRFPGADKLVHFSLYATLTGLGAWSLLGIRGYLTSALLWRWAGIYAVYAVVDEFLQQFVGRTASMADWVADVGGVVVATIGVILWQRSKNRTPMSRTDDRRSL